MDYYYYFNLCLDGLCLAGQGVMHILFASRLTGKRHRVWHIVLYVCFLSIIQFVCIRAGIGGILPIGAGVVLLYGVNRTALKIPHSAALTAAVIAFYISQLSFGMINSAEAVIFPHLIGSRLLDFLLLAALAVFFVICGCCYAAVLKLLSLTEDSRTPYIEVLLFPGLFFFAAQLYILQTSYSFYIDTRSLEEAGKHGALLFLQIMGAGALLCTLYAYRHLCLGFQAQAALQSLTQAARMQKVYIKEARMRCERTKAFRHDIRNHLSVLDGLLRGGRLEEGRAYLKKLQTASDSLSFPYQTGNPVVDILLGEKLGLAEAGGILSEVSLLLPRPCAIDDFDWCVIFANALDNALHACQKMEGERFICITGKQQGDFYMLEFVNTCPPGPLPAAGTGLFNMKSVAEKYHGTVLIEREEKRFTLNILLNTALYESELFRKERNQDGFFES